MRYKYLKLNVLLLMCFGLSGLQAQQSIQSSGNEATGNGGTVSYTVGQVVYSSHSGVSGLVVEGIQQVYIIELITEIETGLDIDLEASVYPNPTIGIIKLQVANQVGGELNYQLYSQSGVLIQCKSISQEETNISMGDLGPATYLLHVLEGSKPIKTFKIIKL